MKGIRPKRATSRHRLLCPLSAAAALFGLAWSAHAGNDARGLAKVGAEKAVSPPSSSEQVGARAGIGANGGLVVWQDNGIDGDGSGIAVTRLGKTWQTTGPVYAVNSTRSGDQTTPDIATQSDGSSLVVWRSGDSLQGHIVGRVLGADGNFKTGELDISGASGPDTLSPAVAALSGGGYCVVWAQREAGGVMQDVYFRRIGANGVALGEAVLANQYSALNQRTPAVTRRTDGGFTVAWISEEQSGDESVDVVVRTFGSDGTPSADETRVNKSANVCADPTVLQMKNGATLVAWCDYQADGTRRSWDVISAVLNPDGSLASLPKTVNSHQTGRQYRPRLALSDNGAIVTWSSFGQDGWDDGVIARLVEPDGTPSGEELQVNTTWLGRQFEPAVASIGNGEALVIWSGYSSNASSVNLSSQKIALGISNLEPLPAPYVSALSATRLSVTWPVPSGLNIVSYEVYFDDARSPEQIQANYWTSKPVAPSSTHTAKIGYVLADGRRGPASLAVEVTSWGEDSNGDGLPDDWQALYWGSDPIKWPSPNADSDGDGVDDRSEFLAGTNPRNSSSVLKVRVEPAAGGFNLVWNTQPGSIYQVYGSESLSGWTAIGSARFAQGETETVTVANGTSNSFYRVTRVR